MPPKANNDDSVTATHVENTAKCCCYSQTFISNFNGGKCSVFRCTNNATHGAHVTIGHGKTVCVIPTCQTCNPPACTATVRIVKSFDRFVTACCCFDTARERACRCKRGNPVCGCLDDAQLVCHCTSNAR